MEFFTEIFATGQVSTANTADLTPPVIFTPSANVTSGTTITGGVATNEANGTLYAYVGQTPSTPSTTSVIAGIGAEAHISMVITSTGAKVFNFTGLTGSTVYYVYYLHRDLAGNNSVIVSAGPVTTTMVAAPPAPTGIIYVFPTHIDESSSETGFRVYLQNLTDSGARTLVATLPVSTGIGTEINYTAGSLVANKLYAGEILALNGSAESSLTYGPFQFRTMPAGVISNFAATAQTPDSIGLAWSTTTPPTWGGFRVQRETSANVWATFATVLTEEGLNNSGVYSFTSISTELPELTAQNYRVVPYNTSPDIGLMSRPDAQAAPSNVGGATTPSSGYVIRADFENGNVENGIANYWSTTGDVGFNNTERVVYSGKCVKTLFGSALFRNYTAMNSAGVFIAGAYLTPTSFIAHIGILNVFMDGDNIQIRSHPSFTVLASQALAPGVGHYPNAPIRHYWIDFNGVDGTVTAVISSTPIRPTANATNSVSYANAALIGTSSQLYISEAAFLDHIRVAPTFISSNPL